MKRLRGDDPESGEVKETSHALGGVLKFDIKPGCFKKFGRLCAARRRSRGEAGRPWENTDPMSDPVRDETGTRENEGS